MAVTTQPRGSLQYEEFYGFVQSPFTLAPDPRFLYPSPSHEEAIRQLLQTIKRREGVAVLSGDIGTGKTTVCRTVLEQLDMKLFTSLVLNPFLSGEELLPTRSCSTSASFRAKRFAADESSQPVGTS